MQIAGRSNVNVKNIEGPVRMVDWPFRNGYLQVYVDGTSVRTCLEPGNEAQNTSPRFTKNPLEPFSPKP